MGRAVERISLLLLTDIASREVSKTAAVQEACKHQLLAQETTDVSSQHCGVTSGPSTLPWASITEIVVRYRHRRRQKRTSGVSTT